MSTSALVNQLIFQHKEKSLSEIIQVVAEETGVRLTKNAVGHRRRRIDTAIGCDLANSGIDLSQITKGWFKGERGTYEFHNKPDDLEFYERLGAELSKYRPKHTKIKRKKVDDGHLLVVDPCDLHIGKYSSPGETGELYNIEIARERLTEGVASLVERARGFPIDRICLVVGNDILHYDNAFGTTTSGTKMDTDGLWHECFIAGKLGLIDAINHLKEVADVHVVFCPSNHDFLCGYMLTDTVSSWFHGCPNVTFDRDMKHRKYMKYGRNLLGFSHGDGARMEDMPQIMAQEAKKDWSETDFRYIYLHHIHHMKKINWKSGGDYIGVTIEYLRSPSATDRWHETNGFTGKPKGMEAFIHSKTGGQVARLCHYYV